MKRACALAATLLALAAAPSHADDLEPSAPEFHGLLRARDLTPFGFRRLDMRAAPTTFSRREGMTLEVELAHQNTWALSRSVQAYLEARPRGPITAADIDRLRAMPGEHYLVDGELSLLDFALTYPVSDRLSAYAVLSAASYSGGFLDGAVENFHRAFGLGNSGRSGARRNRLNVFLDLDGRQVAELDHSAETGLLDPVIGAHYVLSHKTDFRVVLDAAAKIPLSGSRWFSTGRLDVGAQLTVQRFSGPHAVYASGAVVYYDGSNGLLPDSAMTVPTAILGYEYRWTSHTNVIAQAAGSRSTFTSKDTSLSELRDHKYQVSVGLRHRTRRAYWALAVTENVNRFNNTPDVGLQLGAGYYF